MAKFYGAMGRRKSERRIIPRRDAGEENSRFDSKCLDPVCQSFTRELGR